MTASWDPFVAQHPRGHLLQTAGWAALKSRFGWRAELVTVEEAGELRAGAQVLYRPLPGGLWCVAYVPKGPLVDWADPELAARVLAQVVAAARRRRAIVVRVEPPVAEGELPELPGTLARASFFPVERSIQPRRTLLLDIDGSEDEILGRMKQKTRYNIRLADRKEVVVREGSAADLPAFDALMRATGDRNEFGVHSAAYYRAAYECTSAAGRVGLLLAEYQGQPLAGLMVFALGDTAWYFYGASNDLERNRMPAYGLQWAAIQWARARSCHYYDLWGVPDADEETLEAEFQERSDGLWGVYRFKRGFGGRLLRWVGAYDCVLSRPLAALLGRVARW